MKQSKPFRPARPKFGTFEVVSMEMVPTPPPKPVQISCVDVTPPRPEMVTVECEVVRTPRPTPTVIEVVMEPIVERGVLRSSRHR